MRNTFMDRLTAIDPVPQQVIERPPTKGPSSDRATGFGDTVLAANAQPIKLGLERPHAAEVQVSLEDQCDGRGLGRVDDQTPTGNVVAEWYIAAHPHALAAGGREVVAAW